MAISKYTLYKYVKVDGTWRYMQSRLAQERQDQAGHRFLEREARAIRKAPRKALLHEPQRGSIDAGTDALAVQRKRKQRLGLDEYKRLGGKASAQSPLVLPGSPGRLALAAAAEKYFANREARGLDLESIRKYRAAVDPFVEHCGVAYVDECSDNKQVLLAATDDFRRTRLIG